MIEFRLKMAPSLVRLKGSFIGLSLGQKSCAACSCQTVGCIYALRHIFPFEFKRGDSFKNLFYKMTRW